MGIFIKKLLWIFFFLSQKGDREKQNEDIKKKIVIIYRHFATPRTVYFMAFSRLILERVAVPFSTGSSQSRNWTQVSCIAGRFFSSWATREAQEYWNGSYPFSWWHSWLKNWTGVSCIAGRCLFTSWAIREALISMNFKTWKMNTLTSL